MLSQHTSRNQSILLDSDMGTGKDVGVTGMYQDTNVNKNEEADKQPDGIYTLSEEDSSFSGASLSRKPVPVSATSGSNEGSMPIAASDWSNVPRCYPRKQCPIPGYVFPPCNPDMDSEHTRDSPSPTPTEIIEFELSPEEIRQDLKERRIIVRDFACGPAKGTGA